MYTSSSWYHTPGLGTLDCQAGESEDARILILYCSWGHRCDGTTRKEGRGNDVKRLLDGHLSGSAEREDTES